MDDAVIYCIIHQRKCYTVFPGTKREFTGNKREIAEHFEIDYEDFRKRTNNGLSFEEAIDKKIVKRNTVHVCFKGTEMEFTGTKEEIAKHYGISYKMLLDYLNLEMSLDGIIKRLLKRKELKQQAIKLEKEETSTEQIK